MDNLNIPTSQGTAGRQAAKALFEDGTYDLNKFHKIFIEHEDLTEYTAAIELVGSWREWNRLKRDWPAFNSVHIKEWKEELEVIFKSRAIKQVMTSAKRGNFNASRWIAEQGFNKKAGAGRPSKSDKARAAKEIAEASAETKEDEQRIMKVINGGK